MPAKIPATATPGIRRTGDLASREGAGPEPDRSAIEHGPATVRGEHDEALAIAAAAPAPGARMHWWVLVRIALVNSIGYSGTTLVPLWLVGIGKLLDMPPWSGGVLATAMAVCTALSNLTAPAIFRGVALPRLALIGAAGAAFCFALTGIGGRWFLIGGLLAGGICLGLVLNATNRIVAQSPDAQRGYSIVLLVEGLFAAAFFYCASLLYSRFGLRAAFTTLPLVAAIAILLVVTLPPLKLLPMDPPSRGDSRRVMVGSATGLLAIFVFFAGQGAINSSMMLIATAAGFPMETAGILYAASAIVGLFGAVAASVIGTRAGLRRPIVAATLGMAALVTALTLTKSPVLSGVGILTAPWITLFIVPYFFALLARLDSTGRTASVGPAFLLAGGAVGPSISALVTSVSRIDFLGPVCVIPLVLSATLTILATRPRAHASS